MASDFTDTGACNVNGQWATAVRWEAALQDGAVAQVHLRFTNGRAELAAARLPAQEARVLLGERNYGRIAAAAAAAAQGPAPAQAVRGDLRGRTLAFRQFSLPGHAPPRAGDAPPAAAGAATAGDTPAAPEVTGAPPGPGPAASVPGDDEPALVPRRPPPPGPGARAVPAAVVERFLRVGDSYYFPDRTPAFTDQGGRLRAQTDNVEVVRSLVAIAEARGWRALCVTGAPAFRRSVWREAGLLGIDVRGHMPDEVEREELRRAVEALHGPAEVALAAPRRAQAPAPPGPGTADGLPAAPEAPAPPRDAGRPDGVLRGVLVEAGPAPYRFDPAQGPSWHVRLRTRDGERVVWGADLRRAIEESRTGVRPGDEVGLRRLGRQPVNVAAKEGDPSAAPAWRTTWLVEKREFFEQQAAKAQALRDARPPAPELVVRHPDLAGAAIRLWASGEFARLRIEQPRDRERFVALARDALAGAIERGETVEAGALGRELVRLLDARGRADGRAGEGAREESRAAVDATRPPRGRAPGGPGEPRHAAR